jgi:hypothetical protein
MNAEARPVGRRGCVRPETVLNAFSDAG